MIPSAFLIGWALTLLWVPKLGDKYGRKMIFTLSMWIGVVLYTVLMFTESLNVMIAVSGACGALSSIRMNIGFVYMMELMPKSKQTIMGSIWNIFEGCIYVLATIYFWQISKYWLYYVLIGYLMQIFSAIIILWIPESPSFLIEM